MQEINQDKIMFRYFFRLFRGQKAEKIAFRKQKSLVWNLKNFFLSGLALSALTGLGFPLYTRWEDWRNQSKSGAAESLANNAREVRQAITQILSTMPAPEEGIVRLRLLRAHYSSPEQLKEIAKAEANLRDELKKKAQDRNHIQRSISPQFNAPSEVNAKSAQDNQRRNTSAYRRGYSLDYRGDRNPPWNNPVQSDRSAYQHRISEETYMNPSPATKAPSRNDEEPLMTGEPGGVR